MAEGDNYVLFSNYRLSKSSIGHFRVQTLKFNLKKCECVLSLSITAKAEIRGNRKKTVFFNILKS